MQPINHCPERWHTIMADTLFPIRLILAYHIPFDWCSGRFVLWKSQKSCVMSTSNFSLPHSHTLSHPLSLFPVRTSRKITLLVRVRCHGGMIAVERTYKIERAFEMLTRLQNDKEKHSKSKSIRKMIDFTRRSRIDEMWFIFHWQPHPKSYASIKK